MGEGDTEIVVRVRIVRADFGGPLKQRGRVVEATLLTHARHQGRSTHRSAWVSCEQSLQQPLGTVGLTQL
jgi:hypothetical protein